MCVKVLSDIKGEIYGKHLNAPLSILAKTNYDHLLAIVNLDVLQPVVFYGTYLYIQEG